MKSLLLLLGAAIGLGTPALAQKVPAARVPAAARAAFAALFATATAAGWEKEGSNYEVSFQQAGKPMSAVITPGGALQETETGLRVAQLPAPVQARMARDYSAARVGEAARIVRADGTTVYEVEITQGGRKRDVLFTADGQPAQ